MSENTRGPHPSHRAAIRAGWALPVTSAVGVATSANGADKANPKVVQYRAQPDNGANSGDRVNFGPPSSCKAVAGTISPNGWCVLFAQVPEDITRNSHSPKRPAVNPFCAQPHYFWRYK
jgi:hypothetical protein